MHVLGRDLSARLVEVQRQHGGSRRRPRLVYKFVLGVAVAQLPHAEIKLQPSQLDMAANSLLGLPKASDNPGFD